MSVIPNKKVEQVQFCESHAPVWSAAPPTAIGLTAAQCTQFSALTAAARKAYDDAVLAKQAYHAAVTEQNQAIAAAVANASDLIRFIKSYAESTSNPNAVYATAQIPPPAAPSPAPAPGQPTNISVGLEPSGAITLRWKAVNAAAGAGTYFSVRRKLPGQTGFSLVGNTGAKSFTDETLTQGTSGATYIIQGHRGTLSGPESEQISVQFGVGGGLSVTGGTLALAA